MTAEGVRQGRTHGRVLATGVVRVLRNDHPRNRGGRGECRMLAAPMARLQQRTQAAVTTGSADTAGIPRAMGYGLYALSPGSGLSCPRHPQDHQLANLTPASRRQDHTI